MVTLFQKEGDREESKRNSRIGTVNKLVVVGPRIERKVG